MKPSKLQAAFRRGQHVRVVKGPHTGTTGFVDYLDANSTQPRALLDLGRDRMMWVDLDKLWRDAP